MCLVHELQQKKLLSGLGKETMTGTHVLFRIYELLLVLMCDSYIHIVTTQQACLIKSSYCRPKDVEFSKEKDVLVSRRLDVELRHT